MQMRAYILPMLLLSFAPACPATDNTVGAIDPGSPDAADTGGAAGGAPGEAGAPGGATGLVDTGGAGGTTASSTAWLGNLGAPCDLASTTSPRQAVYNDQAPECSSGVCLKPVVNSDLENVDTGPFCTRYCQSDDDCSGGQARDPANPSDKTCITGYTCGVAFVVGSLCCKGLCLCKDFTGGPGTFPLTCQKEASACAR
jgi:hypothetical protein